MCLECGISLYLEADGIALGDFAEGDLRVVEKTFCTHCGGQLVQIGKAGDQPLYKIEVD
jgi:hypothetical protein